MTETIYAGMAGDTEEGRFVSAGLFRRTDGGGWERIDGAFDRPPEVHAILTDPGRRERVVIGTESGIFRSDNRGESWRKLSAPAPELAVSSTRMIPTLSMQATSRRPSIAA